MKKSLAILLTLMMLFAMSSTALAAESATNPTDIGTDNKGDTQITVEVNTENLSVTVPLKMTIVAPISGGDCTEPTTYAIVNKSATPVKVTKIEIATDTSKGLTFSDSAPGTTITDKDKVSIALTPAEGTKLQLTGTAITSGLGGFDIAAATDATGISKAIAIEAKSGMLSTATDKADAFTITYTIAAGTTAP